MGGPCSWEELQVSSRKLLIGRTIPQLVEGSLFHEAAPRAKRGVPHRFALGGETPFVHHILVLALVALLGLFVGRLLLQRLRIQLRLRVVHVGG